MKNKFANILSNKTFCIVISVLLAIVAWLLVLNMTNPYITRTVEIPITFINENLPAASGLNNRTVTYETVATVTLSGRSDILNDLLLSEISTEVDFAGITESGVTALKLSTPECSRLGVEIVDYYPKEIEFEFDNVNEKYLSVEVEYDNSLLKEGYEFVSVIAEPASVPVSGFASDIDQVEYISVRLSDSFEPGSIDSNKTAAFIARYILFNGEDGTHNYSQMTITVKIEVAKRVKVDYSITGIPDSEYYYTGNNSISGDTVLIQGSAADLKKIDIIDLGNISVNGLDSSLEKEISVSDHLPDGVTVYGTGKLTIQAEIKKYSVKEFKISYSRVSKPGMLEGEYDYDVDFPETVVIKVKGKQNELESLNINSLEPTLDFSNKGAGIYVIQLTIRLDFTKFTLVGELPVVDVVITPLE